MTGGSLAGQNGHAQDLLARLMREGGPDDPYPTYGWLRENARVFWSDRFGAYMVSRFDDCERVLKKSDMFRSVDSGVLAEMIPDVHRHECYRILLTSLVGHNAPSHTRLRRLLSRDFTARRVASLRVRIERICDELLDAAAERMRDGAVVDLHETVSVPLPLHVLSELLGVPRDALPRLSVLVPRMLHVVSPAASEDDLNAADAAFRELGEYLGDLIAERRRAPRGDLISALVSAHDGDDDQLTEDELMTMLFTLWAAGFETPAITVDNGVLTMLRHPEHRSMLGDDEGTRLFVDELFRWETPGSISTGRRYAVEDARFGDHVVPAGAQVRLLLNAANRDPAAYPDPDAFRPGRGGPTSLAFGAGMHYCVGAVLAKLEIGILLARVHRRLPGLRLAAEPLRRRSIPLRDFSSFPVTLADPT